MMVLHNSTDSTVVHRAHFLLPKGHQDCKRILQHVTPYIQLSVGIHIVINLEFALTVQTCKLRHLYTDEHLQKFGHDFETPNLC